MSGKMFNLFLSNFPSLFDPEDVHFLDKHIKCNDRNQLLFLLNRNNIPMDLSTLKRKIRNFNRRRCRLAKNPNQTVPINPTLILNPTGRVIRDELHTATVPILPLEFNFVYSPDLVELESAPPKTEPDMPISPSYTPPDLASLDTFSFDLPSYSPTPTLPPEPAPPSPDFLNLSDIEFPEINIEEIDAVFESLTSPDFSYLKLRSGEKIFDRIEPIEDTKGNSGTKGRMVITNLRIIWHSLSSPRINLSIGLNCMVSTSTKVVNSGLRGTTQALICLAEYKTNKYEYIFTNLSPNCVRHYTSVVGVHKAYAASRLYRDLKLRGSIIRNKQLHMLPLEQICNNENGVWNLSSDSGNVGTLIATNVRVVWYADINEAFNVSMPYITIESIGIRSSKFGEALVFVVRPTSGGYVLGFRADPRERLQTLLRELQILHQAYTDKPIFGLEVNWTNEVSTPVTDEISELQELGEPRGEMGPNLYLASMLAQDKKDEEIQPVYNTYLGLAIEPVKEGLTLKSLFEVQSTV